ncbi:tannase/feruloyl esterase family alpha/beta hydrolase [Acinetobacter sp. 197]|uniref:tannase/feruloyl esterase family alpha/beta hydrolase n=1 Tax=Acinetobacter sp. 197 TaxID=3114696 RepID=UPI003A869D97
MNDLNNNILSRLSLLMMISLLAACSSDNGNNNYQGNPPSNQTPQLSPAVGAKIKKQCEQLGSFQYANTTITSATALEAGAETVANKPIRAHCLVTGYMFPRTSPIDGQEYRIGFEMRLPLDWNGRFLFQGNGGFGGEIIPALGFIGSGGPLTNALYEGFTVISSDMGHTLEQNSTFGLDPQARLDYGYAAMTKLTPMAKQLIKFSYDKLPDRSYAAGPSRGGNLALIAATRLPNEFDGIYANSPPFDVPVAIVAQIYDALQLRKVATDVDDLVTAFTLEERKVVADAVLRQCDQLDGITDGMVQDVDQCQTRFNIERDVPVCQGERNGTCLSAEQIQVISDVFKAPVNSKGEEFYVGEAYDPGIIGQKWANVKLFSTQYLEGLASATAIAFQVPPEEAPLQNPLEFALNYNFDTDLIKLFKTDSTYKESSVEFMGPPNPLNLTPLTSNGGKLIVVHAVADGSTASMYESQNWYKQLLERNSANIQNSVRFFRVPGMNHVSQGVATDQFDGLTALVRWVEYGEKPDRIIATARGPGNPSGEINPEIPSNWAPNRTRPLCPYPLIARYSGQGDSEKAESFNCAR